MILTVAALLAYRKRRSSSLEPLTEEEEKDWKKRITRELENIQNGIREDVKPLELALLRCYSDTSPKKKKMGVDDPQPPPDSTTTTTSFRSDVRNEWIQAVFGTDFLSWDTTTTKQGVGLAQIPSFTSYGVKILPQKEEEKLGITLSRLALGLYVRQVTVGSEAWCAGVIPNSVLVSINGMCLLAESSKQALERIWQYEGQYHLQVENNTNTNYSQKMMMDQNNPKLSNIITHPIHMTLIHKGLLYTVTMLTNPPYGIDWSPCGNFALVKRTYAQGATAGVKRGAIIAKVNDKDIIYDGLDHTMCATELREAFQAGKEIQLQLCFTPSEARSGHSERQLLTAAQQQQQQQQQDEGGIRKRSKPTAQHDGVEVRVHPFFGNKNKNNHNNNHKTSRSSSNHKTTSITQLASRVAAGELYSLPKNTSMTCHKLYRPCPPMLQSLLEHWSREDSLLYLLFYHQSGYDEQEFIIRPNTQLLPYLRSTTQHNNDNNIAAADELMQTFLLPLIGFVSHDQKKNDDDDSLLLLLLVETAKSNIELAHRMELVAQALQNDTLKKSLLRLRKEREKEYYQQAAARTQQQQQQSRNEDLACERAPPLLATASGADYEQPCLTVATSTTTMASTIISPAPHVFKKGKTPKVFGFFRKRNRKKLGSITNSPKSIIKPRAAKQGSPKKKTNASEPLPVKNIPLQTSPTTEQPRPPSSDSLFSNTLLFLEELENVCTDIEKSLLRTFSQKIAGWALQPWSASKETALAQVTQVMRERLKLCQTLPLLNPIDSEMLVSLDPQGCYILPSAHFPLLLTFDCRQEDEEESKSIFGPEKLYRTKVELIALRGPSSPGRSFVIHGCVAGTVVESEKSVMADQGSSRWDKGNAMAFDTRSSWGAPKTMSLRLSEACQSNSSSPDGLCPTGFSWVNLAPLWKTSEGSITVSCKVWSPDSINNFDEHGDSQGRSTSGEVSTISILVRWFVFRFVVWRSPRDHSLYPATILVS